MSCLLTRMLVTNADYALANERANERESALDRDMGASR